MGSVSEEEKKYRRQVEDPTDGADEVKVKRTLWDGTVQDEKWKNPKDIKIFANQTVTRGVDPTGRSKTHESQKNHLVGAFSGEAKKGKGVSFNYDPDKYKDTNAANYRRLRGQTDDLKAEEERRKNEKDEAMRKEKMRIMMLSKEGQLFWTTPEDKIVATSDKFFIDPEVLQVLDDMNHQFIGLKPVKEKMRRYASQMLSHKIREDIGIKAEIPPLHHVFTGNPGTGKTTVAMKMGELYQGMGFIKRGHTVQATRADLVGQYIGHTGPKTREMILKSFGGILFIDEAYGLYKEDSRDYGSEVLELLVKFIDTTKNSDFVLVLAGYRGLMTRMLNANLNLMSRMGNWIDFPDYDDGELLEISVLLAEQYTYHYSDDAKVKFVEFMNLRKEFPYFSNARTVRNAMERARRIAATRVLNDALENGTRYSMEELQTFVPSDFEFMSNEIRNLDRQTMLP
jgi:probable Rubsico expression protein CbbX